MRDRKKVVPRVALMADLKDPSSAEMMAVLTVATKGQQKVERLAVTTAALTDLCSAL